MSQKNNEIAEDHLYTVIKVARSEDLVEQIGKHIYFDLVDHDKVHSFRIQKQIPFNVFKEEVAKAFGIPVQYQRFWLWKKHQNFTFRPSRPLTPQEEAFSVEHVREISGGENNSELKLFLEVELGQDLRPVPLPEKTKEDILLFFKVYDPFKEELRYVGRMFVKRAGKPDEILTRINKMAGFDPDEEIELYEEHSFVPYVRCRYIGKSSTFRTSQLEDGDIICFQKSYEVGSKKCRYPDVSSFLVHVPQRQTIETKTIFSEELTPEDMDTFFENLESELASAKTGCSQELASAKTVCSQEVKEALLKVEEALSIAPADFDDSGRIASIQKAIKVFCFFYCSSTFTLNQKAELLSMEKNLEELCKRAANAFKEKNLILEKESIKLTLSQSLESNLIKFKVAKAKIEDIEKKIAILQPQVDSLNAQLNEEERKKEKILGEKEEMFEVCKDSKLKLSALGKEWPEYEARVKAAEEEEKAVEAEWSRVKYFISCLREGLN